MRSCAGMSERVGTVTARGSTMLPPTRQLPVAVLLLPYQPCRHSRATSAERATPSFNQSSSCAKRRMAEPAVAALFGSRAEVLDFPRNWEGSRKGEKALNKTDRKFAHYPHHAPHCLPN